MTTLRAPQKVGKGTPEKVSLLQMTAAKILNALHDKKAGKDKGTAVMLSDKPHTAAAAEL